MSNPNHPTFEPAIVDLIRDDAIQDGLSQLAEAGLDQLLDHGFLRDVPILGTVVGGFRAVGAVRDLLLAKKLGRFLREVQASPSDERTRFADALQDRAERQRVGETLILLLDRLDDMAKPGLLGKAFRALLSGDISNTRFRQIATAIDRLSIAEMRDASAFYSGAEPHIARIDPDLGQAFAYAGIVRLRVSGDGGGWFDPIVAGARMAYERNEVGASLAKILGMT